MKKTNKMKMTNEAIEMVASRFKVLAEPLRLQMLQQLQSGELSVTDLAESVGSTQPNVSKHLKIMQDAGLIERSRDGNTVYYRIADRSIFELCALVCSSLKEKFAEQSAVFG